MSHKMIACAGSSTISTGNQATLPVVRTRTRAAHSHPKPRSGDHHVRSVRVIILSLAILSGAACSPQSRFFTGLICPPGFVKVCNGECAIVAVDLAPCDLNPCRATGPVPVTCLRASACGTPLVPRPDVGPGQGVCSPRLTLTYCDPAAPPARFAGNECPGSTVCVSTTATGPFCTPISGLPARGICVLSSIDGQPCDSNWTAARNAAGTLCHPCAPNLQCFGATAATFGRCRRPCMPPAEGASFPASGINICPPDPAMSSGWQWECAGSGFCNTCGRLAQRGAPSAASVCPSPGPEAARAGPIFAFNVLGTTNTVTLPASPVDPICCMQPFTVTTGPILLTPPSCLNGRCCMLPTQPCTNDADCCVIAGSLLQPTCIPVSCGASAPPFARRCSVPLQLPCGGSGQLCCTDACGGSSSCNSACLGCNSNGVCQAIPVPCGIAGGPCCPASPGPRCPPLTFCSSLGSVCFSPACVTCGATDGDPCCPAGTAGAPYNGCASGRTCRAGNCATCGRAGEPCCAPNDPASTTPDGCTGALSCNSGTCGPRPCDYLACTPTPSFISFWHCPGGSGTACNRENPAGGTNGTCEACGGSGQVCCTSCITGTASTGGFEGPCDGITFCGIAPGSAGVPTRSCNSVGLVCRLPVPFGLATSPRCVPCGAQGQPVCEGDALPCGPNLTPAAGVCECGSQFQPCCGGTACGVGACESGVCPGG